jgi:isoprenylcysteine carboxyl methyltransferase (ICMT) family protein YpbQ
MEILKLLVIILDSKQTQEENFKTFALELMLQVGGFRWECQKSLGQNFNTKLHLSKEAKPI